MVMPFLKDSLKDIAKNNIRVYCNCGKYDSFPPQLTNATYFRKIPKILDSKRNAIDR